MTVDTLIHIFVPGITSVFGIVTLKWHCRKRSVSSLSLAIVGSLVALLGILVLFVGNPLLSECHHVAAARQVIWGAIVLPLLIVICASILCLNKGRAFWAIAAIWLFAPALTWQYSIRHFHAPEHEVVTGVSDPTGLRKRRAEGLSLPRLVECAVGGLCAFSECNCSEIGCYSD